MNKNQKIQISGWAFLLGISTAQALSSIPIILDISRIKSKSR